MLAKTSIAGWSMMVVRSGGQPVTPQYSVEHERSFLQRLFSRFGVTKGLALDIGCGDGFFTDLLEEMDYETCGVDFDSERITAARRRYRRNFVVADRRCPRFPRARLILSSAEDCPPYHIPICDFKAPLNKERLYSSY
jgi:ribosomal protein L11 methylase PrmA